MTARRRILVLAESAHPEAQSVSWIGWAASRALALTNDVHLVTRKANREAILAAGLEEGHDFTAIDLDRLELPMLRLATALRGDAGEGWTTLMALSLPVYYAFEQVVWRHFRDRLCRGEFDLVHRITPVSPTMPSLIAGRCSSVGVPFVLGPINGGLPWPREFARLRSAEREWLSYLRAAHRVVPGYRATRRHASAILAGSFETLRQIPPEFRAKSFYIPENGIDQTRFPACPRTRPQLPIRALFVGRLVPLKCCDMAIAAAAPALREGRLRLEIVGDGPERPRLEAMAAEEGIATGLRFVGTVQPDQVYKHYAANDVLLFPSIREFGGGVVLEAMSMGVVPIVTDHGGPGELVVQGTGLKIPLAERAAMIDRLRAAIEGVLADPDTLIPLIRAARQRVETLFTWQRKAEQIGEVYDWVLRRAHEKPDPGFPGARPAGSLAI